MEEIINFLRVIFNWFIEILQKLDGDTRTNIYIGITGILVAIVIFIAEIISNKKIEIYKRLMLEKTQILKNVRNMIIILAIIWFGQIIKKDDCKIAYFFEQLLINCAIIFSMVQTMKTFLKAIKLNTNQEYFDTQLQEYLYSKVEENIHIKEKNTIKLAEKNKEFLEYIKSSKVFNFEPYMFNLEDGYNRLEFNKYGYITSYNYYILNKIEENLKIKTIKTEKDDNPTDNISNQKPEIYLCKKIGDKCANNYPIAYYKNVKKEYINMINRAITIDNEKYINCDSEISKIIDDIFAITYQNSLNTDDEDILINFYEFICKNKYESIIATFLDKIYNINKGINNINKNEKFCGFLNRLMAISFKYDRYDAFDNIGNYIVSLYIDRIKVKGADLKHIAYRYANDVFIINKYSVIRRGDYKYYDVIMANLLVIIKTFLRKNDIEAIMVLFNNIYFEKREYYSKNEFNDFDIVEFQFIIAIIYMILYMYKKQEKNEEKYVVNISKIIEVLRYKFFELYDIWDTILKFNKYSEKNSEIQKVIESVDFDSDVHKYENAWSSNPLDINQVLKSMIYMFRIQYVDIEGIDDNDISREDGYKYNRLLEIFKNQSFEILENKYEYEELYKADVINLLSKVVGIIKQKETEYELNAEIDDNKVNRFKDILIKSCNKKSKLEELIFDLGKVRESDLKLKRVFGISELIPRNWFIKDDYNNVYTDNVAEDFGDAFKRGINKEVIEYLINKSNISDKTLEETIRNISNIEDYILIANRNLLSNLNFDYNNEYVNVNGKKLYTLYTLQIEKFMLINKNALPFIELCKYDESYDEANIIGNIYFELTDCANDKSLREKIISGNDWIKEKGTIEEQDNYLKMKCDFKVFKAYRIVESDIKDCYIIKK